MLNTPLLLKRRWWAGALAGEEEADLSAWESLSRHRPGSPPQELPGATPAGPAELLRGPRARLGGGSWELGWAPPGGEEGLRNPHLVLQGSQGARGPPRGVESYPKATAPEPRMKVVSGTD